MKLRTVAARTAAALVAVVGASRAEEIGFVEDFALATNRAAVLSHLVAGSDDYYFYTCLNLQNGGQVEAVEPLLTQWIKVHGETARAKEIRNRQALLSYGRKPDATLDYIRTQEGLNFGHAREQSAPRNQYPARLDPALIARDTLAQRAFGRHRNLAGFTDAALDWLAAQKLSPEQRRHLLQRLSRPDVPGLVDLAIADLREPGSGGFGSIALHRRLCLAQLDACAERMPELLAADPFVESVAVRLRPGVESTWRWTVAERRAYLDRLWTFASRLPPSQNSFKAHVLYHRLAFDRSQNEYDRARFDVYLRLPRNQFYVRPQFREQSLKVGLWQPADLQRDYSAWTGLPPIGNDEPLVRDYLERFLADAADWSAFADVVDESYVKQVFAETKLLNGIGQADQWYALIPPDRHAALRDRVELSLLPRNPDYVAADDPVRLFVAVKNVDRLRVQVFALNAFNYFRDNEELNTAVDLDGLAPAFPERVLTFARPPLRRHAAEIEIPEIRERGIYVVELIGGGVSSRAVVRKGRLFGLVRAGAAGHVFTVFNERREAVKDARLWVGGQEYAADAGGELAVPFRGAAAPPRPEPLAADGRRSAARRAGASEPPGTADATVRAILRQGEFADALTFRHAAERYELEATFWLDREALVAGGQATLLVRPELRCAGTRVDLGLLEQPVLEIRAVDGEGIAVTQRRAGLALANDREFVHAFTVPEGTRAIETRLKGRVRNVSLNRDEDLSASDRVTLNGQDQAPRAAASYLRHSAEGYWLEIRGKTGEPRPGQVVNFDLQHRDIVEPVHIVLQTDDNGRIALGPLAGIEGLTAAGPGDWRRAWSLGAGGRVVYPPFVTARRGEEIALPLPADAPAAAGEAATLLAVGSRSLPVSDEAGRMTVTAGALAIRGLEAGTYTLALKPPFEGRTQIDVYDGPLVGNMVVAATRASVCTPARLAHIDGFAADDKAVKIHVAGATPSTRVHLLARWSLADGLPPALTPATRTLPGCVWGPPQTLYVSGRNIGDEYRYVLDRRLVPRHPGNMLDRPSLLISPWETRETSSGIQAAMAGEEYDALAAGDVNGELRKAGGVGRVYGGRGAMAAEACQESLDFLPAGALVLPNLAPDADGNVSVGRERLGFRTQVLAVLADDDVWSVRSLALPEAAMQPRDRALRRPLPADQHLTERQRVTPLAANASLDIEDVRSARMEVYDSVGKVYRLFRSLNDDPVLAELAFVAEWPALDAAAKRERYSRYACHELNVFMALKDRAFFEAVVKPFVAQKKEKQIVDDWLLGKDLSAYLDPAAFQRLNAFERILLGRSLAPQRGTIARHAADRADLVPFDPELFNRRFLTALQGGGLEAAPEPFLGETAGKGEKAAERQVAFARLGLPDAQEAAGKGQDKADDAVMRSLAAAVPAAPPAAMANLAEAKQAKRAAPARPAEAQYRRAEGGEREFGLDRGRRQEQRQRFRSPDRTREWAENQYYRLPLGAQTDDLIPFNGFWRDFAAHDGKTPFLSANVTEASSCFAEMMMALAVLDVPFDAPAPAATELGDNRLRLKAAAALLAFHRQVEPARVPAGNLPLLVAENIFAEDDRYSYDGNERIDKFVSGEFVAGRVYGAQVVLSNPTGARRKADVLLQIPEGTVPVANGFYTRSRYVQLEPYATQTLEYFFYFPAAGEFRHYPAHVAVAGDLAGFAATVSFHVVVEPTRADRDSWPYVSQFGTDAEVLAYLDGHNVDRLALEKIAFRMRDATMFRETLTRLRGRHVYQPTLWSYAVLHRDVPALREYLRASRLATACGRWLVSDLLSVDFVRERLYEHKEYWPLVNARAHPLGTRRQILNDGLLAQYREFMACLAYKPTLDNRDRLAVAVYLLLQDRVDEAQAMTAGLKPADVEERMQLHYFRTYLAFSAGDAEAGRKLAETYRDYPVERWRVLFRNAIAQADEAAGRAPADAGSPDSREQTMDRMAATAPSLELFLEGRDLSLRYRNLKECLIRYYPMDLELLFSRSPFAQDVSRRFATVRAARAEKLDLPAGKDTLAVRIPEAFRTSNLMVEVEGGGALSSRVYTPNNLDVRVIESYGQVLVRDGRNGRPMPAVYVKTYARMQDGTVRFYKDGYTDLRGRFDYASLSTDDLDQVERFALLVASSDAGALVRETPPPRK